ncbi:hypothetical protein [Mycoplana rhizolycopersici]|jgi:multidrug efflux pump subunit AcrA (membrane-fusion protein)|uniref:Uncharacterized protein n=1 Tax=Mycoplana rhizolycopersici TaxID=2746702 RepID=A0ABX2QJ74_9HYPH|nr:hypothetical protein [Rhizobium rhizolycopersici]NVP56416.1 hypothetical protein [Rhizobium rhizolycopersici]
MSQRSIWTIVAVVILLAILTVGYRITGERPTLATTTTTPPVSTEQTGSTSGTAAPSTGTAIQPKPVEGTQPATSN